MRTNNRNDTTQKTGGQTERRTRAKELSLGELQIAKQQTMHEGAPDREEAKQSKEKGDNVKE